MGGFFPPAAAVMALVLVVVSGGVEGGRPKEYSHARLVVDEPHGFFSKLDAMSLKDNSIWNTKDTYLLAKRSLLPTPEHNEDADGGTAALVRKSSMPSLVDDDDESDSDVERDEVDAVTDVPYFSKRDNVPSVGDRNGGLVGKPETVRENDVTLSAYDVDEVRSDDEEGSGAEDAGSGAEVDGVKREVVNEITEDLAPTETSHDATDDADYGSGSSEDEAAISDTSAPLEGSGSGDLKEAAAPDQESDESGSTGGETTTTSSLVELLPTDVAVGNLTLGYTDLERRNKIPSAAAAVARGLLKEKRQYISRPKFVVRNGYVYMKAPPMTQKTIVTTHIPRPPMVMPYSRFMHSYRRGGERMFGAGGRGRGAGARYMTVPAESRFGNMDGADDQYDEERGEDSK